MTNDEALFLRAVSVRQLEAEQKTTAKVLAAVPDANLDYRPDPKAKTALDLAWHLAAAEVWFLNSVADGSFDSKQPEMPAGVAAPSAIASWYEQQIAAAMPRVKAMSADQLTRKINFRGRLEQPAVTFLNISLHHAIHHRGELATYIRPMGGRIPAIYGRSADEDPWAAPQA